MQNQNNQLYIQQDAYLNSSLTTQTARYCKMVIWCGEDSCKVAIVDRQSKKIQLFASYLFSFRNMVDRVAALDNIMNSYTLFKLFRGKNLVLSLDNDKYTVLPKAFLNPQDCADYLAFVTDKAGYEAKYYIDDPTEITVVFGIESALLSWFNNINSGYESIVLHQANSLIIGVLRYLEERKLNNEPKIAVFVTSKQLHLVVANKNCLIYYNRIPFTDSDEALSYILTIMKPLNINRFIHEIIFFGQINKSDLIYKKTKNYIKYTTILHNSAWIRTKRIKTHNLYVDHFDIFSAALC
jgi:hypothetical protein